MTTNTKSQLLISTEEYVKKLLTEKLADTILFHNLAHTEYVVNNVSYIGKGAGLAERELELALICAWFHDVGFIVNPENHEEEGVKIAQSFLREHSVSEEDISQVERAILATRQPQKPLDKISEVVCDADVQHLAAEDYFERIVNLRKEWNLLSGESVSKRKFYKLSLEFFQKHNFHTEFAKKEYHEQKSKNLEELKKQIYILQQKKDNKMIQPEVKPDAQKKLSRGVESMFRLTANNQISLSSIADNKSNILISVNAIIISVTMTVLVTRFDELPNLIIPTLIFILFSLVTIVFAILSTRPNISSGVFTKEDIKENKVNLLFFGNFYNMKLNEYEWAIGELMKNDQNLYGTMIKDQYFLGKVLAKKYKLLRIAYSVFMFGLIISVLAFMVSFMNF